MRATFALMLCACAGAPASTPESAMESEADPVAVASGAESDPEGEVDGDADADGDADGDAEVDGDADGDGVSDDGDAESADAGSEADGRRRARACPENPPEDMACVGGGWFARGSTDEPNEGSVEQVFVETFLMDLREVTNARYTECVDAEICEPAFPYRHFRRAQQPVVAVTWRDADAYCRWRGGRLPSEAEWERGARGPSNTRFPWGDDTARICERAHVKDVRGHGCGTETTREVGTLPAGHWGLFDMAGNVDEWTADWYAPCFRGCDRECGDDCAGEEPRGPCGGGAECDRRLRVVRGGSWWWPFSHATGTFRRGKPPSNRVHHRYGFRCARSLEGG